MELMYDQQCAIWQKAYEEALAEYLSSDDYLGKVRDGYCKVDLKHDWEIDYWYEHPEPKPDEATAQRLHDEYREYIKREEAEMIEQNERERLERLSQG